jgi:hypothetical protein
MIYVVIGFLVSRSDDKFQKGDIVTSSPIHIGPLIQRAQEGGSLFFGLPSLDTPNSTSQVIFIDDSPATVEEYLFEQSLPMLGGYFTDNMTLMFETNVDAFALQIGLSILSNHSALHTGSNITSGIATTIQKLPYEASEPIFRIELIILPLFISFGFVGLVFAVLDALLLKGDNIIELFRVAGISEWYTCLGITSYKLLTTFLPFFSLTILLGVALSSVLFGNGGRWLSSLLLLLLYAFSVAPQGLILAKKFIHSDYKSVSNWFPG